MATGDGRWVGEDCIEACLAQPPRLTRLTRRAGGAIDLAPLRCEHGLACPRMVGRMRLVTSVAWAVLVDEFGVVGGDNQGLAEAGCAACVQQMCDAAQQQAEAAAAMQQLVDALARPAPEANGGGGGVDGGINGEPPTCYLVPKLLARRAPKLAADGELDVSRELVCEHGRLAAGRDTRRVDAATWACVRQVFPQSAALDAAVFAAACGECARSREIAEGDRTRSLSEAKARRTAILAMAVLTMAALTMAVLNHGHTYYGCT